MYVVVISITCCILANTCTLTNLIEVYQDFLIAWITFIESLSIVEISLTQAVKYTWAILITTLFHIILIVNFLLCKVTILRSIMSSIVICLCSITSKHIIYTIFLIEITIVEVYANIKTRFTMAIHIVSTLTSDGTSIAKRGPVGIVALFVGIREAFFLIIGCRVGNRKTILH